MGAQNQPAEEFCWVLAFLIHISGKNKSVALISLYLMAPGTLHMARVCGGGVCVRERETFWYNAQEDLGVLGSLLGFVRLPVWTQANHLIFLCHSSPWIKQAYSYFSWSQGCIEDEGVHVWDTLLWLLVTAVTKYLARQELQGCVWTIPPQWLTHFLLSVASPIYSLQLWAEFFQSLPFPSPSWRFAIS